MAVSKGIIDDIQDRINIVELINEYVPLTKKGKNHTGLCPFHNEKTPSFTVNEEKNFFYCFGCHENGNAYQFLMKYKNLSFYEALTELGAKVGIDVKSLSTYKSKDQFQFLIDIFKDAGEYFHHTLTLEHIGELGLNYLKKRSLSEDSIEKFNIGYAPNEWSYMLRHLSKKNYSVESQVKSSLVARGKNQKLYDYFRHRIIFPIYDELNRIVAFGGRVLDDSMPKYLNSPENYFFKKREILYGLNWSKQNIEDSKTVLLVEGYMDVIICHQFGFQNVAAPLGTSLTERHIQKLSRYADTVIMVFDGDSAGEKAMIRSLSFALKSDLHFYIVTLPDGMDPSDYLLSKGSDAFKELIENAKPALDFRVDWGYKKANIQTDQDKRFFLNDLYAFLENLDSEVFKESALKKAAALLSISENAVIKDFHNRKLKNTKKYVKKVEIEKKVTQEKQLEEYLMLNLLNNPDLFDRFKNKISLNLLQDELTQKIYLAMLNVNEEHGELLFHKVLDLLEENERNDILDRIFVEPSIEEPAQLIQDCIKKLRLHSIQLEKQKIKKLIHENKNNSEKITELLEEQQFLLNEEKKIKQRELLHGRTDNIIGNP